MNRHHLNLVIAAALAVACEAAGADMAVGKAVSSFMIALYSNDAAGYEKTILPHPDSQVLVGKEKLTVEQLEQVRKDVAVMRLFQTDLFRLQGKDVKPDAKGEYPVGTKATFMTQFRGVNLVIPVARTTDGWKVDVRYWLAMRKEYKETDPEIVAKKFLWFLVAQKEKELKEVSTTGSDLTELLKGKSPFEDQYYCLVQEMAVVEAQPGEGMLLPKGEILQAKTSTADHKWFLGMYGPFQLLFELRKEKTGWRTVPRDYLSVVGIGIHPPTTNMTLPEGERRLGQ